MWRKCLKAESCILFLGLLILVALLPGSLAVKGTSTRIGGVLILTMESDLSGGKILHLYTYTRGYLVETWSTWLSEGGDHTVSLNDINGDGKPEIVLMDTTALKIYQNVSGTYELVLDEPVAVHRSTSLVRAHMLDYYRNGTGFLLCVNTGDPYLIGYRDGQPLILQQLSFSPHHYGLDVGDVNNDSVVDIVWGGDSYMITVWEGEGEGFYEETSFGNCWDMPRIVEVRIGDVNGDGLNEIVTVGHPWGHGRLNLCVWKKVGGEYVNIWKHRDTRSASIDSVDIGDVDADGVNEIVTGNPSGPGILIWEFQPEVVYKGHILEQGNYFYYLWEDEGSAVRILYDLSLRVAVIDESREEKIVGVGSRKDRSLGASFFLYIAECSEDGFRASSIPLWENGALVCPTLDVWPIEVVNKFVPAIIVVLLSLGLWFYTHNGPKGREKKEMRRGWGILEKQVGMR